MAFIKKGSSYIQKVRIEVGTLVGLEKDEEAHITLREPTTEIMLKLQELGEDSDGQIYYFKQVLPELIVEHDFYEEDNKLMTTKDVAEIIYERTELTVYVFKEYFNAAFFTRMQKRDSK